jgi:hypothetical protein
MGRVVKELIRPTELVAIIRAEVLKYVADSYTSKLYVILDDEQKLYAVVTVPHLLRPYPSRVVVMAQVVGEKAVIIEDVTDKPLVEALIAGGIPREKIVLAYQGEKLSDEGKG